jgi:hypothetical protein
MHLDILVHAPGYSGEDAGIVEQDLMAGAYVVFHHYQCLWLVALGMMVAFNNPCLDEVTSARTFAVQLTSFMSNGKRFICSNHPSLL